MRFLVNAPARRSGTKRKTAKRARTAAQRRATASLIRANKARRRASKVRTATGRTSTTHKGEGMARRKRKATGGTATRRRRRSVVRRARVAAAAPRRRRRSVARKSVRRSSRRRYRSNPPIIGLMTRGLVDAGIGAAAAVAGQIIAAKLPNFIDPPSSGGGNTGETGKTVNKVIAAAVLGVVASKVLGADKARAVVQGALQSPIQAMIVAQVNKTGMFSTPLSSYSAAGRLASYSAVPALAAYSSAAQPRMLSGDEDAYANGSGF